MVGARDAEGRPVGQRSCDPCPAHGIPRERPALLLIPRERPSLIPLPTERSSFTPRKETVLIPRERPVLTPTQRESFINSNTKNGSKPCPDSARSCRGCTAHPECQPGNVRSTRVSDARPTDQNLYSAVERSGKQQASGNQNLVLALN